MPYRITQCYLSPDRRDIPALCRSKISNQGRITPRNPHGPNGAWVDREMSRGRTCMGPRDHVLDGGADPPQEGVILRKTGTSSGIGNESVPKIVINSTMNLFLSKLQSVFR